MGKPKNFSRSQHSYMASWRGSIDDLTPCPYDPTHVMPYNKLVLHLIPCAKKHSELTSKFITCPYSAVHRFLPEQLEDHLKECKEHQMSVHSRVENGKTPYMQVLENKEKDPDDDRALLPDAVQGLNLADEEDEEMKKMEAEWKAML